jgi:hypothetical protein
VKIIADKRATGKTTKLIYASHVTGARIVCMDCRSITYILHEAIKLNMDIPNPITIADIQRKDVICGDILIDNAEYILQALLPSFNIKAITVNNVKYKELGGVDFGS